jgi:hypothetical protein
VPLAASAASAEFAESQRRWRNTWLTGWLAGPLCAFIVTVPSILGYEPVSTDIIRTIPALSYTSQLTRLI